MITISRESDIITAYIDSNEATFYIRKKRTKRKAQSSRKILKSWPLFFVLNKILKSF